MGGATGMDVDALAGGSGADLAPIHRQPCAVHTYRRLPRYIRHHPPHDGHHPPVLSSTALDERKLVFGDVGGGHGAGAGADSAFARLTQLFSSSAIFGHLERQKFYRNHLFNFAMLASCSLESNFLLFQNSSIHAGSTIRVGQFLLSG
uniref:Uncharacterized protein n=1 Tax=Oryza punctata TaxID=4537 RepID=A0A0E0MEM5_ORYPU